MGNLATNVSIERATEGPQLVLRWTNSDDVGLTDVQVRRGLTGYPEDITEGSPIYADASPTPSEDKIISDIGVDGGVTYYYTIFSRVSGTWYHDYTTQRREFPLDGREFVIRLWEQLPSFYRTKDAETLQRILAQTFDEGWWNYWEDQFVYHGQLRRFLKVFGLPFGNIRELIEYFTKFYSTYDVRDDFLPFIAELIGFTFSGSVSLQRQRFLIANAVALYKVRGTMLGVELFATGNFETVPLLREFRNNVLESDILDRTSVDGSDEVLGDYGGPWDTIDRVVDGTPGAQWSYRGIGLFFDDVLASEITQDMIDTAARFFSDFIPGTSSWHAFTHWDSKFEDPFADFSWWSQVWNPQGALSATGGRAVFNVPSAGVASGAFLRSPTGGTIISQTEFAIELDLRDIVWPTVLAFDDANVDIVIVWPGPYTVTLSLRKLASGNVFLRAIKSDSGGAAVAADYGLVGEPTEGRLRLERGTHDNIRYIAHLDGEEYIIARYASADFAPLPDQVMIHWGCSSNPTGAFNVESEWFRIWQSSTGWQKVYPV